jgi:hypothetical protein
MPWGRLLLAVLLTALVGWSMISLTVLSNAQVDFGAIGLSSADRAALDRPFDDLVAGREAEIAAAMAQPADPAEVQAAIAQMRALLPPGVAPTSSRIVNWRATTGTGGNWLTAVAEHRYPDHLVRSETVLTRASNDQPWMTSSFHINVVARSEIPDNSLSFAGRPPGYVAIVVAAFVLPIFMLATFWAALLFWASRLFASRPETA